jgi:hypothetical protein
MQQKAKTNSEDRKLCNKNKNKYIPEKDYDNNKEIGNVPQQSTGGVGKD